MNAILPRRAYPENAPMTELRAAELFAVMALRFWVAAYQEPAEDRFRWQAGIQAAGLSDEGATAFNALLLIVAASSQRPLDVRCPKCLNLSGDEATFLQMLSLAQRDCATGAELALSGWLPPSAARTALPFIGSLAQAMNERGLRIPQRPTEEAINHRFILRGVRIHDAGTSLAMIH
jgi:hypothetical protein